MVAQRAHAVATGHAVSAGGLWCARLRVVASWNAGRLHLVQHGRPVRQGSRGLRVGVSTCILGRTLLGCGSRLVRRDA